MSSRLKPLRRYLAQKVRRGISAIRLRPEAMKRLSATRGTATRQTARLILQHRQIQVIPKKTRRYKILTKAQVASHRTSHPQIPYKVRKIHLADRLKDKTITRKMRWIYHVRRARALIKGHRESLGAAYRTYYRQIKGGLYRKRLYQLEKQVSGYSST